MAAADAWPCHRLKSVLQVVGIDQSEIEFLEFQSLMTEHDFMVLSKKVEQISIGIDSEFTFQLQFKPKGTVAKYLQIGITGLFEKSKFSGILFSILDISHQKEAELNQQEIIELKNKEDLILKHQKQLERELDSRIRELSSNLMLISQKNTLINLILKELEKTQSKIQNFEAKKDIRRLIGMIMGQNVFDDNWEKLKIHFVKMHPGFFNTLRNKSSKVTEKDLRHCA